MRSSYSIVALCFLTFAVIAHEKVLPANVRQTPVKANAGKTSAVRLSNVYTHAFSDMIHKDTFSLTLTGKTTVTGKVLFKIVDFKGKIIFTENFEAQDMLGDLTETGLTTRQQEDTIRARVASFFKKKNFSQPAIASSETFDDAYSNPVATDKKDWYALKADRQSIGFIYSYGYEGTAGIAWLKNKKKVFQYFYSD